MRRRLHGLYGLALAFAGLTSGIAAERGGDAGASPPLLSVEPGFVEWTEEQVEVLTQRVLALSEVASRLKRDRFRVLKAEFPKSDTGQADDYRLLIFDYTRDFAIEVAGKFSRPQDLTVREIRSEQSLQAVEWR